MAAKKNPALAVVGVVGLGVFAWLNWSRIKQVSSKVFTDITGEVPPWTLAEIQRTKRVVYPCAGAPQFECPPGVNPPPDLVLPETTPLPGLSTICETAPALCGIFPTGGGPG